MNTADNRYLMSGAISTMNCQKSPLNLIPSPAQICNNGISFMKISDGNFLKKLQISQMKSDSGTGMRRVSIEIIESRDVGGRWEDRCEQEAEEACELTASANCWRSRKQVQ